MQHNRQPRQTMGSLSKGGNSSSLDNGLKILKILKFFLTLFPTIFLILILTFFLHKIVEKTRIWVPFFQHFAVVKVMKTIFKNNPLFWECGPLYAMHLHLARTKLHAGDKTLVPNYKNAILLQGWDNMHGHSGDALRAGFLFMRRNCSTGLFVGSELLSNTFHQCAFKHAPSTQIFKQLSLTSRKQPNHVIWNLFSIRNLYCWNPNWLGPASSPATI